MKRLSDASVQSPALTSSNPVCTNSSNISSPSESNKLHPSAHPTGSGRFFSNHHLLPDCGDTVPEEGEPESQRARAPREHQRNLWNETRRRVCLLLLPLPLRERGLEGGSAVQREDASRGGKKKRDGLCNAGTCLHVPSESMLAEEDTLPLRLLLGSATLY